MFYDSAHVNRDPRLQFGPPAAGILLIAASLLLAGCPGAPREAAPPSAPADARALIERSIPPGVSDRAGWASDMYNAFIALTVAPTRENACAVVAVIEQESGFHVDPVIPGLGAIARGEIALRAERAHVPMMIVNGVLQLKSADGRSYGERIDAAKTEKELSDVYEDFIAAVPLGTTLFAEKNPIRTRGPMQVNVAFAEQFAAATPYPYATKRSIADELFTRRGSVYFGTAHLLDYRAPYDNYLYRFADFNAGQYSSRNAAFQSALSIAAGVPLATDGALLPHDSNIDNPGATELALRSLSSRLKTNDGAIHAALLDGRSRSFETNALYAHVYTLAGAKAGRQLPHAIVPRITLAGPKIKRSLTTDWYAHRVNQRFQACLGSQ
jgi:Protein of unknown function (DUF1615)